MSGPERACIDIDRDDVQVTDSELAGCGRDGVNAADPAGDDDAADIVVRDCKISRTDNDGVVITGSNAVVEDNKFFDTDGSPVSITGANALVQGNRVDLADDYCIDVEGSNPTVSGNKCDKPANPIRVTCLTDCASGLVGKNLVEDANGSPCFRLRSDTDGLVVEKNKAKNCNGECFQVEGPGLLIEKNVARGCGVDQNGFLVEGTNHTIVNNSVKDADDDAFEIHGSGHLLSGNKAINGRSDGFDVEVADMITLENNKAIRNHGNGFEISATATNTTLSGNTGSDNRLDLCDDGAATATDGNDFPTTGSGCGIDD